MAQPTASVQIKKLSADGRGSALRAGRQAPLPHGGRPAAPCESCEEVFRVFAALEASLADMRALESGRLRLAVSTTGMCFAPRLLGAFVGLHPGVETSMQAHNRQALVERLAKNEDDLYLFADAPEMEDVVTQELLPNPLVVLARDDHPLARGKEHPLRAPGERALPHPRGRLGREADHDAALRRARARSARSAWSSAPTRRSRRRSSRASASRSCRATRSGSIPNRRATVAWTSRAFPLENHWYFAYPQGKQLSPVARAFLDFARVEAKKLVLGSCAVDRAGARPGCVGAWCATACRVSRTCARRRSPCRRSAIRPARGTRPLRAAW